MGYRQALLVSMALLSLAGNAWSWQPVPSKTVAERIKHDAARCKRTAILEACDDAVRWNPNDPALLVAFGDALLRAQHPAQAMREYQRAAALAPKMPGVGAKISAAEARLHPARVQRFASARVKPVPKLMLTRNAPLGSASSVTNDAADTHSH